jgi:hypothetical protein
MSERSALRRMAAATLTIVVLSLSMIVGCSDEDTGGGECTPPAAPLAFAAECCANSDCSSGKCGQYMSKGNRCTKDCTTDADCADLMGPGTTNLGCGGQGICKVP